MNEAVNLPMNPGSWVAEFKALKELGQMALKSGFLPSSIKTPEQAIVIMMKGRELGIPPMQAFSSIAVVNGKPTMSAELMLSLIYKNVKGAVINFLESTAKACVIEAKRPGGKPTQFSFTMEDAKRANLLGKGPWQTYPQAMLRARCISAMARAMFPDALSGVVYTPEELGAEVNDEGEVTDVKELELDRPAALTLAAKEEAEDVDPIDVALAKDEPEEEAELAYDPKKPYCEDCQTEMRLSKNKEYVYCPQWNDGGHHSKPVKYSRLNEFLDLQNLRRESRMSQEVES